VLIRSDLHADGDVPNSVWITDRGEHSAIWDADASAYEHRVDDFLGNA